MVASRPHPISHLQPAPLLSSILWSNQEIAGKGDKLEGKEGKQRTPGQRRQKGGTSWSALPTQLIRGGGAGRPACSRTNQARHKPLLTPSLPHARAPALGSHLTARTEVVHPFVPPAQSHCDGSNARSEERPARSLKKKSVFLLSCQSGLTTLRHQWCRQTLPPRRAEPGWGLALTLQKHLRS